MSKWWNWLIALSIVCLLLIAVPISYNKSRSKEELQLMFNEYIEKFNKTYKNNATEYQTRLLHFVASLDEIDRLNSLSRGPEEHRAIYGPTRLSDMSKDEYKEIHLSDEKMSKPPNHYGKTWDHRNDHRDRSRLKDEYIVKGDHVTNNNVDIITRQKRYALPLQIDWRAQGVIGRVRDQGMCGACWAFSTVGAIEAMSAITTGKLTELSVQEVIDCAGLGNSGCSGGDICLLLDWLTLTGAPLQVDAQYPLRLLDGACRLPANASGVRLGAFTCDDLVAKEEQILEMLATHGPVAVAVNALTWQNYLGGVVQYHCSGAAADLNHAVLLVGYDLTGDVPYYIAKNSWGSEFGLGGYLHLAVGSNICGLANEVASVDVK